jgi:hypothetical protein
MRTTETGASSLTVLVGVNSGQDRTSSARAGSWPALRDEGTIDTWARSEAEICGNDSTQALIVAPEQQSQKGPVVSSMQWFN